MKSKLSHIYLYASDLDNSYKFYKELLEILGYKEMRKMDWGIPEDEANGSGSMKLAHMLNRELTVHHGKGSIVYAKPFDQYVAIVGGRVKVINQ